VVDIGETFVLHNTLINILRVLALLVDFTVVVLRVEKMEEGSLKIIGERIGFQMTPSFSIPLALMDWMESELVTLPTT
jgi:hypothetical protein